MDKPFSPSCERNREPILKVLKEVVTSEDRKLLEIGSGTGQHAVYLAPHFPHMIWVTSDMKDKHSGIKMWLEESGAPNIIGPGAFEVGKDEFPRGNFDIVFTANTFHIMHWKECKTLMKLLGRNLTEGAQVLLYGPFNEGGTFSSPSNAEFDKWLKDQDPLMGIRNLEDIVNNMKKNGFHLSRKYEMPANNQILLFMKVDFVQ